MRSETTRTLIADDHPVFREGLRTLLEAEPGFRVVGEAGDGGEALKLVRQLKPEILLLDIRMPKMSGLEVLRELMTLPIPTRTIVLTAAVDKSQLVEALQLGARGIVLKHSATHVIFKCIRCVMTGLYWICDESASDLVHALLELIPPQGASASDQAFGLTPREKEVIALIGADYSNKDIAKKVGISEHTVKHHLGNIFDKLGVSNRLELVLFSIEHRLIENV
jgi:DNA-binding NarL/FixJ family response regulator